MIGIWKGFLLDKLAEWGLPAGGEWSFVVNNNYHPHCNYLNVMWFHNGGEFPRVVVKFCEEYAASVRLLAGRGSAPLTLRAAGAFLGSLDGRRSRFDHLRQAIRSRIADLAH